MLKDDLENKIMSEIKSGKLKLRSKYVFLAEKLGLSGVFVLSVVLAILFFNLVLFYMRASDNLEYLSFGKDGILAFLESFPYLLVIGCVVLFLLAGYLLKRSDFSYKKRFSYLVIGLVVVVMVVGAVLAYTRLPEEIEEGVNSGHPVGQVFKLFLNRDIGMRDRGVAGVIYEAGERYLIIETPKGLIKLNLEDMCQGCLPEFEKGQIIMAVGERQDNEFLVNKINVVGRGKLPMIRRGIEKHLGPYLGCPGCATNTLVLPPHLLQFDEEVKSCVQGCMGIMRLRECLGGCMQ